MSEGTWNTNSKEYEHPCVIAALFTVAKIWNQPRCPSVDEWMKQLWGISTVEFYQVVKRNKILPFATVWIH